MTEATFLELAQSLRPEARAHVRRLLCVDQATVDDVIQSSMVKAWQQLATVHTDFRGWFFTILTHTAQDWYKFAWNRRVVATYDDTCDDRPAAGPDPLAYLEREELLAILDAALSRLRPDDRNTLLDSYVRERAKQPGDLRMRVLRARRRLRTDLRLHGHTFESLTVGTPRGTTKRRAWARALEAVTLTQKPHVVYRTRLGWYTRYPSERPVGQALTTQWVEPTTTEGLKKTFRREVTQW